MGLRELKEMTSSLNILYVEDDQHLRESTYNVFSNIFNRVDTACDGEEGLEKYHEFLSSSGKNYDLVITDIVMPYLDGIKMSEEILKENPEQIIVIISAHNEIEQLHRALDLGIYGFVTKPINYEQLIKTLERAVSVLENQILKQQLIEKDKMASINRLLNSIAHHWRQPLNSIAIKSEILIELYEEDELEEEIMKGNCQDIMELTKELSKTIDSFHEISKVTDTLTSFSVEEVILSIVDLMQLEYQSKSIEIELELLRDTTINGNKNECTRTLVTIINNAYEAILKKENQKEFQGKISIKTDIKDEQFYLTIQDNGVGMEQAIINYLFEPYYTTKFQSVGTGLSLYFVKQCVENMLDGKIEVTSNLLDGTTFLIQFPIKS